MSSDQSRQANQVVIYNIHVLYNPKRGEIKLGQVRTLRDRAYVVSKVWNDAPVIICGDVNCTPKSPLYKFLSEYKISLSGLARAQVSGQYAASKICGTEISNGQSVQSSFAECRLVDPSESFRRCSQLNINTVNIGERETACLDNELYMEWKIGGVHAS